MIPDDAQVDEFGNPIRPSTEVQGYQVPFGWTAKNVGSCRSCGASIMWTLTPSKRPAPIDPDGRSHFATCPQADTWRKGTGR